MNGMLVATKDFDFVDKYRGPQKAVAGRLHVREGSELALSHPENFQPADERSTKLRSEDSLSVPTELIRVTDVRVTEAPRPTPARTTATTVRPRREPRYDRRTNRWTGLRRASVPRRDAPDVDQRVERDRRLMRQQRQLEKARVSDSFGPTVVTISERAYRDDVCMHVRDAMALRDAEVGFQMFAVPEPRRELHISRIGRPAPNAIRTPTSFTRDESWDTGQLAVARQHCPGSCEAGFLHTHADGDERLSDEDVAHALAGRELFGLGRYTLVIATPGARGWDKPELHAWTAREQLLQDTFPTGRVLVERSRVLVT